MTPFEAVYGYLPLWFPTYDPRTTAVETMDDILRSRDQILSLLLENLRKAQNHLKKYADLKRSESEFKVGDQVYLCLKSYY